MSFDESEIQEFKNEALDLLEAAEKSLLALDRTDNYQNSFNQIFRGFHNLKGAAGMMDMQELQKHTHELENLLMGFKDKDTIPPEYVDIFLKGIDGARSLLDGHSINFDYHVENKEGNQASCLAEPSTKNQPHEGLDNNLVVSIDKLKADDQQKEEAGQFPKEVIQEFISEGLETIENIFSCVKKLESNVEKDVIDELYRGVHSIKGSAYLFSYVSIGDLAHAMESCLEPFRNKTKILTTAVLKQVYDATQILENLFQTINQSSENLKWREQSSLMIKNLDSTLAESANGLAPGAVDTDASKSNKTLSKDAESISSIRVPVNVLDNLMTLMGEMVLVRNQVLQFSNCTDDLGFLSLSKRLNVVTSEIQNEMMKTRLQPIGNVLSKFQRVVRDLSAELEKKIQLQLFGSETELDKSLLEAIKDPLTHIVRNSCDHGIELPADRVRAGKSNFGTITIKSYHEGGQVIIEIKDDGRGLSKSRLIEKSIEKKLITKAQADVMTDKEVYNLIFAPGFSTAQQITNVSGRGVGMDVVRTNIEKIGGLIDLSSEEGVGTTIKLKIPLTLAIVPALILKCSDSTFAIPQVKLEELVRVDQENGAQKIELLHGAPVYKLRGHILPLVDLNALLNNTQKNKYQTGIVNIAVVNAEQGAFGIIFDEVLDTADIVVKPINKLLKSLLIYSGATILGDGSVALILDIFGISKVSNIANTNPENQDKYSIDTLSKAQNSEVQDYLLFSVDAKARYAMVLNYVHRLEKIPIQSLEYCGGLPVIRYRDIILPLVIANKLLFNIDESFKNSILSVIVIKKKDQLYGLLVNEILDTLSTDKELVSPPTKQPGLFGSLNLESELIVVVDPYELIDMQYPQKEKAEAKAPQSVQSEITTENKQVRKILLAEDMVFFRKAIKSVLEKEGYGVLTANDGQQAFDMLNEMKDQICMVISDIEMPRMNGFQLADKIRSTKQLSHFPLMAVSSLADKKSMSQGKKAGFDIYLEKLNAENLLTSVRNLLSKASSEVA